MQGSGKTTLAGRLALHLKKDGLQPLLVGTDFQRAAASEQLRVLGEQIDVPVYVEEEQAPAPEVGKRALAHAERIGATAVVVDTRGAVALDDAFADELAALADEVDPIEVLIVVDAMTGQEAVTLAQEFDDAVEGTGIVVTKVDSDTRGGAVLSVREVTGLPIKFITTGERLEALEVFHPDRFASRILGMGDVVSLVEKAKETIGERDAKQVARRMQRGEFDLEDFLTQMQQVKEMGPLSRPARHAARLGRDEAAAQHPRDRRALLAAQRGDHPLDDPRRAAPPRADRRLPAASHRRRLRHAARRREPPLEPVPRGEETDAGHDQWQGTGRPR